MRFKKRKNKVGQLKVKTFFALLPVTIDNETRWLEKVSVRYVYSIDYIRFINDFGWKVLDFECEQHFPYGTYYVQN